MANCDQNNNSSSISSQYLSCEELAYCDKNNNNGSISLQYPGGEEMSDYGKDNIGMSNISPPIYHYSNKICFLSNEDFDYMVAAKHEAEEAIGWKVLPENVIYRVENMSLIQTKWGSRCILHLRDSMGQDIKVWAPSNLVRDLKSGFKLNGKDCLAFIKSLGEKETNVVGERRRKFFDFETVYLPL